MDVSFFEEQPYSKSEISNETASQEIQSWNTDAFIQNTIELYPNPIPNSIDLSQSSQPIPSHQPASSDSLKPKPSVELQVYSRRKESRRKRTRDIESLS